jgi:hypothetical protein
VDGVYSSEIGTVIDSINWDIESPRNAADSVVQHSSKSFQSHSPGLDTTASEKDGVKDHSHLSLGRALYPEVSMAASSIAERSPLNTGAVSMNSSLTEIIGSSRILQKFKSHFADFEIEDFLGKSEPEIVALVTTLLDLDAESIRILSRTLFRAIKSKSYTD